MSDTEIVKQFPYDLKAEATTNGYRISGHCYGESMDGVVTDLADMISKAITEFEKEGLPLVANTTKVADRK